MSHFYLSELGSLSPTKQSLTVTHPRASSTLKLSSIPLSHSDPYGDIDSYPVSLLSGARINVVQVATDIYIYTQKRYPQKTTYRYATVYCGFGVWDEFILGSVNARFFYDSVYPTILVHVVVELLICRDPDAYDSLLVASVT